MKLHECTLGTMVITDNKEVGHITGICYTTTYTADVFISNEDLLPRIIPKVKFISGERGVHQGNLKIFKSHL